MLFSWSSGLAEVLALVVGYNAFQALKCCCSSDRYVRAVQPVESALLAVSAWASEWLFFHHALGPK